MFKKISSLIAALLITTSANSYATGWSGEATVVQIYLLYPTQALIKLSNFNNPTNCLVNSEGHLFFNPTTHKEFLSLFMTAYAAKTKVNIYVTDQCVPLWAGTSYAEVGHVKLI